MADAAKPPAADPDLGLQHLAHPRAQGQVGVADDALGNPARAIAAGRAHRCDAVDEFDLAHRGHLGEAGLPVHRAAFEKDGGDDVVSALDVGQQFGQQVAPALRRIPEMVVRVDDRQFRLQRRLGRALGQPCREIGVVAIGEAAVIALGVSSHFPLCVKLHAREKVIPGCPGGAGPEPMNTAARPYFDPGCP